MLQQILRDMHVDPEILAELDDTQKQTLFCRMREEQVRRWRVREEQEAKQQQSAGAMKERSGAKRGKNVTFKRGEDGEPWVWVMGEHADDKSIEEILEAEARDTARRQAEQEAQQLRHTVEAELGELLMRCDLAPEQTKVQETIVEPVHQERIEDSMEIYCSVDELRSRPPPQKITVVEQKQIEMNNRYNWMQSNTFNNGQLNAANAAKNGHFAFANDRRDVLQELTLTKPHRVAQRVAMWERRVIGERTSEIFKKLQRKKLECAKEAEEAAQRQEHLWREQERKAKEAEFQIREIARRAREQHRRSATVTGGGGATNSPTSPGGATSSGGGSPPGSLEAGMARPPSSRAVLEWYREHEVPRNAGIERDGRVSSWFHGLITRQEAEQALSVEKTGTFLVRLSERIWGYAISYKDNDRIKHYLVDASNGHYQFLGDNQLSHKMLGDLVTYHATEPITMIGGELLKLPCPLPRKIIPKLTPNI